MREVKRVCPGNVHKAVRKGFVNSTENSEFCSHEDILLPRFDQTLLQNEDVAPRVLVIIPVPISVSIHVLSCTVSTPCVSLCQRQTHFVSMGFQRPARFTLCPGSRPGQCASMTKDTYANKHPDEDRRTSVKRHEYTARCEMLLRCLDSYEEAAEDLSSPYSRSRPTSLRVA